jgi:hypothetical protein
VQCSSPANAPTALPQSNVPRPRPQNDYSQFENPAEYATGPGASRIVTWSNLNGQSIDSPPLPPTDAELHAAASLGLNGGPSQPSAVLRTSPGSASGWNGGFYPPPQRQLPGGMASMDNYPQQGAPLRATAPGTNGAANSASSAANEPHAGFVIAPANPLAGFEADRQQYDQQYQQQVDQSYAQSPSGYIRPPAESIPVPTWEVPVGPHSPAGPPLTPNGTPWPGRSAAAANTPPADFPSPASNSTQATTTGPVAPPPYQSRRSAAPTVAPPAYRRPSAPAESFDISAPMIVPGSGR